MNKLNMQTTNIVDENIKRIGELFPNCLTERLNDEGKPEVAIDFDQLRQELSKDIVEGAEERYQFTWPIPCVLVVRKVWILTIPRTSISRAITCKC